MDASGTEALVSEMESERAPVELNSNEITRPLGQGRELSNRFSNMIPAQEIERSVIFELPDREPVGAEIA